MATAHSRERTRAAAPAPPPSRHCRSPTVGAAAAQHSTPPSACAIAVCGSRPACWHRGQALPRGSSAHLSRGSRATSSSAAAATTTDRRWALTATACCSRRRPSRELDLRPATACRLGEGCRGPVVGLPAQTGGAARVPTPAMRTIWPPAAPPHLDHRPGGQRAEALLPANGAGPQGAGGD